MTRFTFALVAALTAAGCVREADPLNHPCPCSDGLVCCASTGLCMTPAGYCPPGVDAASDGAGGGDVADAGPAVYQRWTSTDPEVKAELKIWRGTDGTVTGTFTMGERAEPLPPATDPEGWYPPAWFANDPADGGTAEGASADAGVSPPKEAPLEGWAYSIQNGVVGFVASGARDQLTFRIDRFEYYDSWCGLQLYNGTAECLPDCNSGLSYDWYGVGPCLNGSREVSCAQQRICCTRLRHYDYTPSDQICICDSNGCRSNSGGPEVIFFMKDGKATGGLRVGGAFPVDGRYVDLELQRIE